MDSNEYWKMRAKADNLKVIRLGEKSINNLKRLLLVNFKSVEKQIEEFYLKYGDEPNKQLTIPQLIKYKMQLKNSVKKYPRSEILKRILREDAPKYKIERLRALETSLQEQLAFITSQQEAGIKTTLEDVGKLSDKLLKDRVLKSTGVAFDIISAEAMQKIINTRWLGGLNFSDRIWRDSKVIGKKLSDVLQVGIPQGEGIRNMTRQLRDVTNSSYYDAYRLVRTESIRVYNAVTGESYKQALEEGLAKEYRYNAILDNRTSKICEDLNGKTFPIEEYEIGVNAPPLHPNCRSYTELIIL